MTDDLPSHTRRLFAHYSDPARLPGDSPQLVLAKLMEEGDSTDLRWLTQAFDENELAAWIDDHGQRQLSRRSLAFWQIVLARPGHRGSRPGDELWPL